MVKHLNELKGNAVTHPQAFNAIMKVLVSPKEGWEGYVMRVVEVGENGFTPKHSHPWPHINYVIEGEGEIFIDGVSHPVSQGSYAFIENNLLHQFVNKGTSTLKFICIVPEIGHQ